MRSRTLWFLVLVLLARIASGAIAEEPADNRTAPVVATHYFYWYRWPDRHFNQPGAPGHEGHFHHLPNPESVSYLSVDWHEAQLRSMRSAGIDVALPVYWGAPGAYARESIRFSRDGLAPMVAAAEKLGADGVRLGLFYDTSTLLNDVRGAPPRGGKADLTTAAGRALFTDTVLEYFEMVPAPLWGRVDGRALVVLYTSAFAARWDESLGKSLRSSFEKRFPGESLFLVSDVSWGEIAQDRTTAWGAALWGPKLFAGVAQIGPGYDDSPVPGRSTPRRDREDGNYYRHSWRQALAHRPRLVLIETWNELHEGTEICETIETGKLYLEITAEWTRKLKQGGPPGPEIPLRWTEPRNRPDRAWGESAKGRAEVRVEYGAKPLELGLRARRWADGPLERHEGFLRSPAGKPGPGVRYVYFQVSDHWAFEVPREPSRDLILTVHTAQAARLSVEYDSHDRRATLGGAYTLVPPSEPKGGLASTAHTFRLSAVYFANRQNGGSDFRLVLRGPTVDVTSVRLAAAEAGSAR